MKSKEQRSIETLPFQRPDDHKLSFEIIDLSKHDRAIPATWHRHDFYEIVLIVKGKTTQLVDFESYSVKDKEVLIIPKNSIHQGSFKEKLHGFILLFTPDFFSKEQYDFLSALEIFNASYNSNLIKFNKAEWNEIIQLFNVLKQSYFIKNTTVNKITLRFLLLAFSSRLNEFTDSNFQTRSNPSDTIKRFFDLLEANYKKHRMVDFYCSRLNMTSKKLSQTLANATGKTSLHLINNRLILEAKRELSFSKRTIKEIASDLGFDDQLYFSKFFKQHTALTPRDFRKGSA